jgi:hypothetical protein
VIGHGFGDQQEIAGRGRKVLFQCGLSHSGDRLSQLRRKRRPAARTTVPA